MGNAGMIEFTNLSESTQNYLLARAKDNGCEQSLTEKFEVYDFFTMIKPKYVRDYQYEYYAPRYEVAAFEIGENDEIEGWLTRESYDELPSEEKKEYVFFKWNDRFDWYDTLSRVIAKVEIRLDDYKSEVSWREEGFHEHLYGTTTPIRLIVEAH